MSNQTKKPVGVNRENFADKVKSYLRHPGSMILMLLVMLAAFITFALLLFLIFYILVNGIPYIKPSLFSLHYTSENASVIPALINTVVMTLLSLLIAVPFGIFSAIFLVEYAGKGNKFIEVIRLTTETLSGTSISPSAASARSKRKWDYKFDLRPASVKFRAIP